MLRSAAVEATNRRLIRPSFQEAKERVIEKKLIPPIKSQTGKPQGSPQGGGAKSQGAAKGQGPRKTSPPDSTNAENFYYVKQMQQKTPMVVVLRDGEEVSGVIEWYDKACLKVNRAEGPNVMVYKSNIKYMYKAD
jgi:sRNA-binding regulator protein Hfq